MTKQVPHIIRFSNAPFSSAVFMQRWHLFEFEDQPWFPHILRQYMTDYLCVVTSFNSWLFHGFAKKLKAALIEQNEKRILDLCSGGAGPWPQIATMLARDDYPVKVTLSDFYPNLEAFASVKARNEDFDFVPTPVDATKVPKNLRGFRTILNGFHHFSPEQAQEILSDAARNKRGIAVMELVSTTPCSFLAVLLTPLFLALLTPFIRPFRLSRILLTYVLPLIPFFTIWDGLVSCLRVYSPQDLHKLTANIDDKNYQFDIGVINVRGTLNITYLIGTAK